MNDPRLLSALLLSFGSESGAIKDKKSLIQLIAETIRPLLAVSDILLSVVNDDRQTFSVLLHHLDPQWEDKGEYASLRGKKFALNDGVFNIATASPSTLVVDVASILRRPDPPAYLTCWVRPAISRMIAIRLRSHNEIIGVLFLFIEEGRFGMDELDLIQNLSYLIAPTLKNLLFGESSTQWEKENESLRTLIRERENEKALLLSLGKEITSTHDKKNFLDIVRVKIQELFPFDEIVISLLNTDRLTHSPFPGYSERALQKYPVRDGIYDRLLESQTALLYDLDQLLSEEPVAPYVHFFHEAGMREMLILPLRENNEGAGGIFLYSKEKGRLHPDNPSLLQGISSEISIGVVNIRAYEKIESQLAEIHDFKSRLEEENLYLQEQIKTSFSFTEMVGSAAPLQKVIQQISIVAPSDSTVLLLGETGTGKELVAKAIHNASSRKEAFMVRVNCATLPANLVESELFGHERGSFTGAVDRRIGKFELADNSTLFLDEIGEMPLELQVKLLRALQEKEIERIGGKGVIRTNVRIIAATNRDLRKEVEAGRFRSDLFYRLNVFPIHIPPLRERKEDIPMLVSHFIEQENKKLGKKITNISHKALDTLMRYDWPGNIRELEHLIERSVLLATSPTIKEIPLPTEIPHPLSGNPGNLVVKTLEELEKEHILNILKKCNGRIGGPSGAATLLSMPATTLHSRIKKLGIKKKME